MIEADCPTCGRTVTGGKGERVQCCGTPPDPPHEPVTVIRPCGVCDEPITTAEICPDCADERPGDVFDTPWGKGKDIL